MNKPELTTTKSSNAVSMTGEFEYIREILASQDTGDCELTPSNIKSHMRELFSRADGTIAIAVADIADDFKAKTYKDNDIPRKEARASLKSYRMMQRDLKKLYKQALINAKHQTRLTRIESKADRIDAKAAKLVLRIEKAKAAYNKLTGMPYDTLSFTISDSQSA